MAGRKQTEDNYTKGIAILKLMLAGQKLAYTHHYHSQYWWIGGKQQSQAVAGLLKNGFVNAVAAQVEYEGHITDAGRMAVTEYDRRKLA